MSDDRVERPDDEKEDVSQPEEPTQETPHNPFGARPNQGGCEHSSAPYGQYGAYNPYQQSNAGAGNRRGEEYRWNFEDYEAAGHGKPPKRNRGLLVFGVLLAVVMVVGIVGLSAVGVYSLLTRDDDAPPANSAAASLPSGSSAPTVTLPGLTIKDRPSDATNSASQDGTLSTIEIARRVRPSVVGVITYGSYNSFQPSGEGSGIVMNADGYILTNAHVVEGAIGINVKLDNGDSYAAELIGSDAKSDLAVIRIQADELAAAEFGNSDELEAGERVVAIGNPGGTILAGSVTQGIVSGLNRALSDGGGYSSRYIQVDAAINPGNSGGALVNEYGQVVGINSAKITQLEYEGIGFAIPINEAKPVIDDLMNYGYVKGRAKLGITGNEINEAYSRLNNLPIGIYILTIEPTSDLAGKNVNRGDVILKLDGEQVQTFDDISVILKRHLPGDTVKLTLYRAAKNARGQTFDVSVRLMEDSNPSTVIPR